MLLKVTDDLLHKADVFSLMCGSKNISPASCLGIVYKAQYFDNRGDRALLLASSYSAFCTGRPQSIPILLFLATLF